VLRARLTTFHWIVGGTLLAGGLICAFTQGPTRLWLLGAAGSVAGLCVGLGVSFPQWQMFGRSLCRVRTQRKAVALTFDDGPDPDTTPALLSLLDRQDAKATFFCVGLRAAQHPALTRRIAEEGHQVENHSFQHNHWTNLFSFSRLEKDIARTQKEIRRITGRAPQFFRPPMGLTNPRVFRVARKLGLEIAGYTARGLDRRDDPPGKIVARLLRKLRPGAILLLHDGGVPRERLLGVVTLLLDRLQAGGYQCLRLDQLINGAEKR
jgi:peptidoglycan/xylan/chitin deacetylase (PgdA/CDA1 family)